MRIMALELVKDEIVIVPDKQIQTILMGKDGTREKTDKTDDASKQVSKKMISICGLFTLPFTPYQLLLFFVGIFFTKQCEIKKFKIFFGVKLRANEDRIVQQI